jgi:hypothetical protein
MPKWSWLAVAALLLASCNLLTRDQAVDARAQQAFAELWRRQDAQLLAQVDPGLKAAPQFPSQLAALERLTPTTAPKARKPISTSFVATGNTRLVSTVDEYDYGDRRALVSTQFYTADGGRSWTIRGLNVRVATTAELAANHFFHGGKTLAQYAYLLWAIASPLLMIAALIKVIRTQGLRRKWLWGVLAFAGLCAFSMNWSTGQLSVQLISIQVVGAGVTRGLSAFSAWMVATTLPVGALLILTGVWANPTRAKVPAPAPAE